MREVRFERNIVKYPAGSCMVSFGDTKVICTASISYEVPHFLQETNQGWITAEYGMLPGSTGGGRKRRSLLKQDGRSVEIQRLIGRALRSSIDLNKLGEVTITVDCDVLVADGGTRTAAISGGWAALYDALGYLAEQRGEESAESFLIGQVAAVSVGFIGETLVCDLNYEQDSQARVDMNVVMRNDSLVEVQGTGEQGTFSRQELDEMLNAAHREINNIYALQNKVLGRK